MVTIVHNPMSSANPSVPSDTVLYVKVDSSINYISVPWQRDPMTGEEIYPTVNNTCGNGACSPTDDDHCLCLATIEEDYVFDSLPSREDVLTSLHVGAFDPETYSGAFDYEIYINETYASDDVGAFVSSDAYDIGDTSTIFEVIDEFGQTVYLKNFASKVTLGGAYTLRNPVGFIDLAKVEERDAEYEVDAFLKHLIRYRSAAPFICKKLIQYFGISNPPPAYVERVTKAFMSGSFTSHGTTFGDGNYGSLAAVSAAITLDAEALSSVVDEDPISGNIREPLLKVIQVMRR